METTAKTSWLRIAFMVAGLLALIPLTLMFGVFGFILAIGFLIVAAVAK